MLFVIATIFFVTNRFECCFTLIRKTARKQYGLILCLTFASAALNVISVIKLLDTYVFVIFHVNFLVCFLFAVL